MPESDYVIVGGGLAAASAVDGIRDVDGDGSVAVLSEEEEPPYHRPPLSKEFLQAPAAGRGLLHVKPEGWFDEAGAALHLGARARRLDPDRMEVETAEGERWAARRILLATGGRPRQLPVPGAELDRVLTLRTVGDSEAIRDLAREADRAVLVGAGFIGMELAASLATLDVEPTVVEVEDRVWSRMLPERLSAFMKGYFRDRGVDFRLGTRVEEFVGDPRLRSARLAGGEELPCDLAVVGVGIEPNQELARDAGLEVRDGVVVDGRGETAADGVFATGDACRFPDPVFGGLTRVEHWDHAKVHGKLVGRNMAGADEDYAHLSYFFSDVFDLGLNVYGRPGSAEELVLRGEPAEGECVAFGAEEGRLTSALMINAREAMDACRELVRARPPVEGLAARLADPAAELEELAREAAG